MKMIRCQIYLSEKQVNFLTSKKETNQINKSEFIRRILDQKIEEDVRYEEETNRGRKEEKTKRKV